MDQNGDVNARLVRLAKMLDQFGGLIRSRDVNDSEGGSAGIRDDRLRALTSILQERVSEPGIDVDDVLIMRMMLDDFAAAVRDLRQMVGDIDSQLNNAGALLKEGRRAAALEGSRANETKPSEPA